MTRSLVAVFIGGGAVGLLMPGMAGAQLLSQVPSWTRMASLILIPLLIGFAVGRRGWLAAAGAYVFGMAIWVGVHLRPSPPWAPSDVWFPETWILFIVGTVMTGTLLFAMLGGIGSWLFRLRLNARKATLRSE